MPVPAPSASDCWQCQPQATGPAVMELGPGCTAGTALQAVQGNRFSGNQSLPHCQHHRLRVLHTELQRPQNFTWFFCGWLRSQHRNSGHLWDYSQVPINVFQLEELRQLQVTSCFQNPHYELEHPPCCSLLSAEQVPAHTSSPPLL